MCASTKVPSQSIARVWLFLAASLPIAVFVVLPALISENAGGWTMKYTHNPSGFSPDAIPDLSGHVAVVTGGNTGIGFETAKRLTLRGAEVILTARTKEKGDEAVSRIVDAFADAYPDATHVHVKAMVCDLSSLKSVQKFVSDYKKLGFPIHILVLNAGVMKSPGAMFVGKNMTYGYGTTEDGFEEHIGINHIAHHFIATSLRKQLEKGAKSSPRIGGSRVISVSSSAHVGSYPEGIRFDTWRPEEESETAPEWYEDGVSYGQSKLANILFVREFARRNEGTGVTAYALHPGVILSDLSRYMMTQFKEDADGQSVFGKMMSAAGVFVWNSANMKVEDGALTQLYLASAPLDSLVNGGFYWPVGVQKDPDHPLGKDDALAEQLWTETEKAIEGAL